MVCLRCERKHSEDCQTNLLPDLREPEVQSLLASESITREYSIMESSGQKHFPILAEASKACKTSTAIYKSLAYVWRDGGWCSNDAQVSFQTSASRPLLPPLPPQFTGNNLSAVLLASYENLLTCFLESHSFHPGAEAHIQSYLRNRALLAASTFCPPQAENIQPVSGKRKRIDQSEPKEGDGEQERQQQGYVKSSQVDRACQTSQTIFMLDQSIQTDCPVQEVRTRKPPRRFVHHSALIHLDVRPDKSPLRPIAQADYQKVINSLRDDIFYEQRGASGGTITYEDYASLTHDAWINDKILVEYLTLISQKASAQGHKIGFFDTFFMERLQQSSELARLIKLTNKTDLEESKVILVPFNINKNHWSRGVTGSLFL